MFVLSKNNLYSMSRLKEKAKNAKDGLLGLGVGLYTLKSLKKSPDIGKEVMGNDERLKGNANRPEQKQHYSL